MANLYNLLKFVQKKRPEYEMPLKFRLSSEPSYALEATMNLDKEKTKGKDLEMILNNAPKEDLYEIAKEIISIDAFAKYIEEPFLYLKYHLLGGFHNFQYPGVEKVEAMLKEKFPKMEIPIGYRLTHEKDYFRELAKNDDKLTFLSEKQLLQIFKEEGGDVNELEKSDEFRCKKNPARVLKVDFIMDHEIGDYFYIYDNENIYQDHTAYARKDSEEMATLIAAIIANRN